MIRIDTSDIFSATSVIMIKMTISIASVVTIWTDMIEKISLCHVSTVFESNTTQVRTVFEGLKIALSAVSIRFFMNCPLSHRTVYLGAIIKRNINTAVSELNSALKAGVLWCNFNSAFSAPPVPTNGDDWCFTTWVMTSNCRCPTTLTLALTDGN
jgi:hypothetical protein